MGEGRIRIRFRRSMPLVDQCSLKVVGILESPAVKVLVEEEGCREN